MRIPSMRPLPKPVNPSSLHGLGPANKQHNVLIIMSDPTL